MIARQILNWPLRLPWWESKHFNVILTTPYLTCVK